MKKFFSLLLPILLVLSLSGCGSASVPELPPLPSSDPVSEAPSVTSAPAPTATPAPLTEPEEAEPQPRDPEAVDVDLTELSSTMVYSEVNAMVYEPEQFAGKTVKMRGIFATQEYQGQRLYACIVQDATACCSQGLEFELAGDYAFPEDYPEPGSEITVVGTFDSYTEEVEGNYYLYLVLREARFA